jgi:hypothetical protein
MWRTTGKPRVAVGVGLVLAVMGLAEARRLAIAGLPQVRQRARVLGLTRVAVAGLMLFRPALLPSLLGLRADATPTPWLPRLLAVRELVIGTNALASSRPDRDPLPALLTISAVDGAEAVVILAALSRRELPWDRALGFVLADLGSAAALPVLIKRLRTRPPRTPVSHGAASRDPRPREVAG